ncbi:S8 family peptidase [Labedella populi]|uniref:S8 family peptidase n=1 Tax=Labedella populi TaxID=2498850 RepID=A0A3S4DUN9_9MICO|nr:S8 family peptidase [Labedella populi]RWZ59629.1 S8 family peptidase [Labedella populi]
MHPIEIELWYRASGSRRDAAQSEVQTLVEEAGGSVTASVQIGAIGYHGLKCEVPSNVIQALASGDFEGVRVVKSANVMFLRVSGQSLPPEGDVVASVPRTELHDLPQGNPVVCLLDGIPATNHPLLSGRVSVFDPDEIGDGVSADERRHGTHMSSVAIWGDLASPDVTPAARPVLVRPILAPSAHTANRSEEVREVDLMPDLMRRVFRELFEEDEDGAAVASEVVVVNLSVGDPATPFDTIISSWARMLDWLSYEYGVLVIVSAGNHTRLPIPMSQAEFSSLQGEERRQAMLDAQESDRVNRRLLSPGESINALTVGAAHADAATASLPPYLADPADGHPAVSPITAFGGGYRRSIKPELLAPGGRAVFTPSVIGSDPIIFRNGGPAGPGIRVADPVNAGETHISGTSPAAAEVTRYAAKLVDELERIAPGTLFSRRERALATKALIAHSAVAPGQDYADHTASRATTGNGVLARDLTAGCAENEATLLFLGAVPPGHSQELLLPLPDGLSQLGAKRVSATLAWLSPVNWRHRQYRQASLSFSKPGGGIPDLKAGQYRSHAEVTRGATTLQRLDWEVRSSFAVGYGDDLALTVKCFGQAGVQDPGLLEFAVAITLWVDDSLGVDVYSQVAEQITVRTRQAIRP